MKKQILAGMMALGMAAVTITGCATQNKKEQSDAKPESIYSDYTVIANAGGKIGQYIYTESKEALDASYAQGVRLYKLDLRLTKDGTIILRHDWNLTDFKQKNLKKLQKGDYKTDANGEAVIPKRVLPTLKQVQKDKIYGQYDTMTIEDLLKWMDAHKDVYVLCDAKQDTVEIYQQLYNLCQEKTERLKQVVLYSSSGTEIEEIAKQYPFEHIVLYKGADTTLSYNEIVRLKREYNIQAAVISTQYQKDFGVTRLKANGIKIYWETIDDKERYQTQFETDGIVSNRLTEEDLSENRK